MCRVQQAFQGFATIWIVIGLGWFLAHFKLSDEGRRRFLSRFAFTVGSPALLALLVSRADLSHLCAASLAVNVLAIVVAAGTYLLIAAIWFRPSLAEGTIGSLLSSYTNAGNLGLPIATYVLGDGSWVAPIMLIQVGVLQPLALAILDASRARAEGRTISLLRYLTLPVRNPITLGVLVGLALALTHQPIPEFLAPPVELVGSTAVPLMLISFGASLRLDPLPGKSPDKAELAVIIAIKVVLHPLAALLIGTLAFHLSGPNLMAVTVLAALPSAQNLYIMAGRYGVREMVARDAVFMSTILCIPVIFVASTVLR